MFLVYVVGFVALYNYHGPVVSALAGIPALTTAYTYGKWVGLASAGVLIACNTLLVSLMGSMSIYEVLPHVMNLGSALLLAIAFVFGYMGDITKELRAQVEHYEKNGHH